MFTGIVTDKGQVAAVETRGDTRILIDTRYRVEALAIGASVCCNGVCLTVVTAEPLAPGDGYLSRFAVDASAETLDCTNLGDWRVGTPVNLEGALKVGDELGGHIVSGHVDGYATVRSIAPEGASLRYQFDAPAGLMPFIASKGSVALDGVSLTVNEVDDTGFGVNIIPHTQTVTTFAEMVPGTRVNLEIDLLARYVARLTEARS